MRIIFEEDGSFLELLPTDDKIMLVLCGRKSYKEVTMASAELSEDQVSELLQFLLDWQEEKEEHFT